MDNAAVITTEAPVLPLDFFYAVLKENEFAVTPLQIINANRVVLQYAAWVKNEDELCQYLSPLFAGSEDEQELFKKLFKEHFTPGAVNSQHPHKPPTVEDRVKKHWKKLLLTYTTLALVVLAIIWLTSTRRSDFHPSLVKVFIADKNEPDKTTAATFRTQPSRQFGINISCQYIGKLLPLELYTVFDWGDSTDINALPTHIYLKQGEYRLKATASVLYKNDTVKKVIFYRKVLVCPENQTITIRVSKNTDSLFLNEPIRFRAVLPTEQKPGNIKWLLDGKDAGRGAELQHSFNIKGFHTITCIAVDDSIDTRCNAQKELGFTIYDKKDFFIKKDTANAGAAGGPGEAAAAPVSTTDIVFLSRLYISLAVAFFLLLGFFIVLWLKELKKTGLIKNIVLQKYKQLAAALGAAKSPAILPFKNRNYIPADELDIDAVTKQLRRRVKDNTDFLHIGKTIAKTIEQGGLIQPVKVPRTRQTEYLILIDEYSSSSLQVNLFEYLALLLKKHNVLVDTFYYKKEPAICYNANEPAGIRLEKMYGKYQRHILLLFGDGYQLIDTAANEFKQDYSNLLHHWQHIAIITPVPFKDWQYKEKNILLPNIPLVPLDMQGLVLLAEMFAEQDSALNISARLNLNTGVFYNTGHIDFSNTAALRHYCDRISWAIVKEENNTVNILFEWVAALAVYPVVRWEILLAVGKVILEKYGRGRLLNFTSLLFLVRISWMKDGKMPEALRLDLLKTIQRDNELLARETILQLLKEIPEEETPAGSSNFAEKEIQQVINEFSLYASDPVYYSSYRQSKYLFKKLWTNKQLNDGPAEEYLKNSSSQWETLLNNSYNSSGPDYRTGVEQYLLSNEKEETLLAKIYLALAVISAAVFVSSLFALRILYIWDNFL